jgi:hypothetical protein
MQALRPLLVTQRVWRTQDGADVRRVDTNLKYVHDLERGRIEDIDVLDRRLWT